MAPNAHVLSTRRGKQTLVLLCAVGFVDFVDAAIVNVALPSIRRELGFSVQSLQWVISAYVLTYGGLMLLGGRAADLLGRRRLLLAGTSLFFATSLAAGVASSEVMLIGARPIQGVGAAMMLPAALSILTTTSPRPATVTRQWARGERSEGSPPPPACSSAACCPTGRAGVGSSS